MLPQSKQGQGAPLQSHLSIHWRRGVLNSTQVKPAPPQQKPQQLSNFSCFFCSPTFFVSFCSPPDPAAFGGHELEEGVAHGRDRLCFVITCCINISCPDLFGDIGRPTTGNGAGRIVVLCPTPKYILQMEQIYSSIWINTFCNMNKYISAGRTGNGALVRIVGLCVLRLGCH